MKISKSKTVTMLAAATLFVGAASIAWACTGQSRILSITPSAAGPNTTVSVTGEAITPGTAVEIRWNATNGSPATTAVAGAAGTFSVNTTVPDVAPGIYYLAVSAGDLGVARSSFEVTGKASAPTSASASANGTTTSPDLWSGFQSAQGGGASEPLTTNQTGSSAGLAAGVALTAVASIGGLAGLGMALRRRSPARRTQD